MKKNSLFTALFCVMTLFAFNSSLFAQDINDDCPDGKCDDGLHCVKVTINGSSKKRCCKCSQSVLDSERAKENAKCKCFKDGESFNLIKNPKYISATSKADSDAPRYPVGIYDEILEEMKACKAAKIYNYNKCWGGGDTGHNKQVTALDKRIRDIADQKKKDYEGRRIFYCSKSSYSSSMGYYKSECKSLNTSSIEDALERMESDLNSGKEIDCDKLKKYIGDCEDCREKAYNLIQTAFDGSSSKAPRKVQTKMDDSEALAELGEEVLKEAKSKDLCE
jgi:hypothetical protein